RVMAEMDARFEELAHREGRHGHGVGSFSGWSATGVIGALTPTPERTAVKAAASPCEGFDCGRVDKPAAPDWQGFSPRAEGRSDVVDVKNSGQRLHRRPDPGTD